MALTDNPEVNALIDRLCGEGCTAVQEYITVLEQGGVPSACAHLDETQRSLLLAELKAIMAVYDLK